MYLCILLLTQVLCIMYIGVSMYLCLVLLRVPKCFVLAQFFWASPKLWLHLVRASSKTFVPAQKPILLNANHLLSGTKCLWLPQYVNRFLVWHKKFGPTINILGPVKGNGINIYILHYTFREEIMSFCT